MTSGDRETLRTTFGSAAANYQQARPDYPSALLDELVHLASLRPGSSLLEIGSATGKATIPLGRRGFRITSLELSAELAAEARRNLADFGDVEVIQAAFETWQQPAGMAYDLVFAATAWHWIDPAVGYQRAAQLLRPGGHLAIWSALHVFPPGGDTFFHDLQPVYDEIGEGVPRGVTYPAPGEQEDDRAAIEASGLFCDVQIRHFDWEIIYTAEEYIRLIDTFSACIAMEQWQRDRLYGEIRRRLAERPTGTLRRHWGVVLQVATVR